MVLVDLLKKATTFEQWSKSEAIKGVVKRLDGLSVDEGGRRGEGGGWWGRLG